jgi:hypothetical protein
LGFKSGDDFEIFRWWLPGGDIDPLRVKGLFTLPTCAPPRGSDPREERRVKSSGVKSRRDLFTRSTKAPNGFSFVPSSGFCHRGNQNKLSIIKS